MPKLTISASQLDSFLMCPRQWWFKRVMKLPEVQKDYFTFGTVLHAVIERWLVADMRGRDAVGIAVNPFPEGWETVEEKGQKVSVTPNEARLIRKLFEEAVDRGILVRDELNTIEREIRLPVLENVELIGYVDIHKAADNTIGLINPAVLMGTPEIHDHKTFGPNSVRYLKQPGPKDDGGNLLPIESAYAIGDGTSPNCVGHSQQMLTYAAATSQLDGYWGPVLVRHNQFPKFEDPKGVRKVEALLSHGRQVAHWDFVQETAEQMLVVADIKEWTDTPGPNEDDACSRFGGCPFVPICTKTKTPESYAQGVENVASKTRLNLPLTPRKRKTGDGTTVDIFARAKAQQAARGAQAPAPTIGQLEVVALKRTAPAVALVSSAGPDHPGAPWADPACPACKGFGVNSKGRACPICDRTAEKRGVPTSSMYRLALTDSGRVLVDLRPEHEGRGPVKWEGYVPSAATLPLRVKPEVTTKVEERQPFKPTMVVVDTSDDGYVKIDPKAQPIPGKPVPLQRIEPVYLPSAKQDKNETSDEETPAKLVTPGKPTVPIPVLVTETFEEQNEETPTKLAGRQAKRAEANKGGRPRVGCTILLGVAQIKGAERPALTAQELLEQLGAELAKDMGAESYWALDPFKRRERLRQKAAGIVEGLGRSVVMVPGGTNDPDLMSLINGLIPHAEFVFEALR